ncbi:hypothetical protein N7509_010146 [Penicillium cosmopolitanum]|uniref:Uncharacterized protein n=1 Tax=Penicillium cosmopolitanum TaxID=1131564 RepID=A0A9X0B4B9_9EURO|nr:uncharacterized protein N7509_010146 [Penicillium cosmopolitanum]KAJ5387605.1 hypothetical protein N7509_010146 [Penicillium cosmopolitanum]
MSLSPEKRGRHTRPRSSSRGPTNFATVEGRLSCSGKHKIACLALQASNNDLEARITHLRGKVNQLDREISVLSRHVKQFNHHPFLQTWQADLLTRLIEVAYVRQKNKLPDGVSIGETNTADREILSRAYSNAARRVKWGTLDSLGLDIGHHDALQHYSDIAVYRSPNPFDTEIPFAEWLVQQSQAKPDLFAFWARLYPICYGRAVYESLVIA